MPWHVIIFERIYDLGNITILHIVEIRLTNCVSVQEVQEIQEEEQTEIRMARDI
jgi:hypothetical protein